MTRKIILLLLTIVISGCLNPYCKYYEDYTGGKNILNDPKYTISTDAPKLRQGFNLEDDNKKMIEDGYRIIGVSSFNATDISQNKAIKQAKIVHADTVIVYKKYTHTESGSMPLTTPTHQSGTIYGSGGMATYSGTSYETSYVPYNITKYDYFATYWVKLRYIRIGIYTKDLTDELRQKVGSNKGIYITIVVKNSPAFNNDLLVGDIIRRVNGIEVIDNKHYLDWLNEAHPSEVSFEICRNGETIIKKVQSQYFDTATGEFSAKMLEDNVEITSDSNSYVKQTQAKPNAPITKSLTVIRCENCGHEIGRLEKAYVYDGHIVCSKCYLKRKQQP